MKIGSNKHAGGGNRSVFRFQCKQLIFRRTGKQTFASKRRVCQRRMNTSTDSWNIRRLGMNFCVGKSSLSANQA